MGQFGEVLRVVDAAHSDHVVGSFLAGVAELARSDVNRAALDFAQALKTVPGFFPAAFYLGACYAAGGQDKEAATVWRTTLVTDPSAPWIYTALSLAGQPDQAIKTLDGYLSRRPADGDRLLLSMRLLYEARILGRPLDTADADRAQFLRYFSAYEKLSGAKLDTAREWRKYFDR
ncbi:MAG TPA: hypothetical protein VES67_24065 [Vicinamibacterales bacterium]|nr:hypothetical protein [Vicinamibacterales bacterium]